MKKSIYIICLIALLLSCKKENNCFITSGKITSETIYTNSFKSIEINDFIDVIWKKSSEFKIELEGGENFLPGISCEIKNNLLVLTNNNGCKFLRRNVKNITVTLFCPLLDTLTSRSSGEIIFNDAMESNILINCIANQGTMRLKIDNNYTKFYLESGSNDIHVKGSSRYCNYYNAGITHFYAKEFNVDSFRCHSRSKGITEIKAKSWLNIEQNGESDINYWGNPQYINIASFNGNGEIINRE